MDFDISPFRDSEQYQTDYPASRTASAEVCKAVVATTDLRTSLKPASDCAPHFAFTVAPPLPLLDTYRVPLLLALERSKVPATVYFSESTECTFVQISLAERAIQPTLLTVSLKAVLIAAHQIDGHAKSADRWIAERLLAGLVSVEKSIQTNHRATIDTHHFDGQPLCRDSRLPLQPRNLLQGTVMRLDPLAGELSLTARGHLYRVRFLSTDLDADIGSITLSDLNMKPSHQERSKIYEAMKGIKIGSVITVEATRAGSQYLVPISRLDSLQVEGRDLTFRKQLQRSGKIVRLSALRHSRRRQGHR